MKVYRFREAVTNRTALTRDPSGEGLPHDGAQWHAVGPMNLELPGFDWWPIGAPEIRRALAEQGVFILTPM